MVTPVVSRSTCQYCRRATKEIQVGFVGVVKDFNKTVPATVCDYCDRIPMMTKKEK